MHIIFTILKEYGLFWCINRTLYCCKIKLLNYLPITEKFFEQKVTVKRINLFDFDVDKLSHFVLNLDIEIKQKIIKQADDAVCGKILGFSSIFLDYGNPINWQLNPITQKQCDSRAKWYTIPDFDKQRGDIKVIWEISRFSHLFLFVRAFFITNDHKYYNAFVNQIHSWVLTNSYSYGANYKCGQECALRLINVLMVYCVFDKLGFKDTTLDEDIKILVRDCYKKILSNFFYAHRCIKNNHTLSELAGMIAGAWCCCDNRKVSKAYRLYNQVVLEQFTEDGGYCQYSFNYQRLAMQIFECICKMSEKTKRMPRTEVRQRLYNSALLMYQCQNSDGDLPNYGSNDGALIFPITSCQYRDFRPVINTTSALAGNHRVYDHGMWDEELVWFGKTMTSFKPIAKVSSAFQKAGLFTLRNEHIFIMIVLNDYSTRPAHMDQLHCDIWVNDYNVFCDSGSFSYSSDLGRELISNLSHNTVVVPNKKQMTQHGKFLLYNWTKRQDYKHTFSSFEGSYISKNGYTHRRWISLRNDCIEIRDEVCGLPKFASLLHTPCVVNGNFLMNEGKKIVEIISNFSIYVESKRRSLFYLQSEEIGLLSLHCSDSNTLDFKIRMETINHD